MKSWRVPALSGNGITAPGHAVAQSGAHAAAQQSMSAWSAGICSLAAIGQSARGTANAGPEAIAKDKASTIRANRRRMRCQVMQPALTDNYPYRSRDAESVTRIA